MVMVFRKSKEVVGGRWCLMVEKVYIKHGGSDGKVKVHG